MEWFSSVMDGSLNMAEGEGVVTILIVGLVMLFVWFLPALLALAFNRKHAKAISIACIPGGFSIIAWCGLIGWAVSGKVMEKYKKAEPENKP